MHARAGTVPAQTGRLGKNYLAEHADKLFKGKVCGYRDGPQQRGDYPSQMRCKLNMAGTKACKFWGHDKVRMAEAPHGVWAPYELVPIVQGKYLWIMHKEVGITLECTDLMCLVLEQRCPFEQVAPFN